MKTYIIILILVFYNALAACKPDVQGKYLIPFRQGEKWGMCDENGKMIVHCKFDGAVYKNPFVFAWDTGTPLPIKIFDKNGLVLDSCSRYISICGNRYFIMNRVTTKNSGGHFRNFKKGNSFEERAFASMFDWDTYDEPFTAYILLSDKTKKKVSGTFYATLASFGIMTTVVDGKCGVYNICTDSFIIPPVYNSISYIRPDMLLAVSDTATALFEIDGARYAFHVDTGAFYFDKFNENTVFKVRLPSSAETNFPSTESYRLVDKNGDELISPERHWEYGKKSYSPDYIELRKSRDSMKNGYSPEQMADLNGNIILYSERRADMFANHLYQVTDLNPQYKNEYIYSGTTGKILFSKTAADYQLLISHGLPAALKDGEHYFYNDKGEVMAHISDMAVNNQGENNLIKKNRHHRRCQCFPGYRNSDEIILCLPARYHSALYCIRPVL